MGNVMSKQTCTLQPGGVAVAGADGVCIVKASSCCCCSTAIGGGGGEVTLLRGDATARLHRRRGLRRQRADKTVFGSHLVSEYEENGKFLGRSKTKKSVSHPNLPKPVPPVLVLNKKEAVLVVLLGRLRLRAAAAAAAAVNEVNKPQLQPPAVTAEVARRDKAGAFSQS
jgi:hypothetical protein